jgi:hypothetical protein
MIRLYQGGGAGDFTMMGDGLAPEAMRHLFENAAQLLATRGQSQAADMLRTTPFTVTSATNNFNDEFSVLYAVVPLEHYEQLRKAGENEETRAIFHSIADVISELGTYIRFVIAELELKHSSKAVTGDEQGLKQSEIQKLVNNYIGVSGGYLADFSYRTHHEFYVGLDLEINPYNYAGTTRERFIKIMSESSPDVQVKILEGILERFPEGSSKDRTPARIKEIKTWIARLQNAPKVDQPKLRITSEVVERALRDAQELLRTTGAVSGVDRVHTALHGYLQEICRSAGIQVPDDSSLTKLFKQLREEHPAFKDFGPRSNDILRLAGAFGTIIDTLNPLRNQASVAHPNAVLLKEPEAMLVINAVRTILHYLDEKISRYAAGTNRCNAAPKQTSNREVDLT